VNTRLEKLVGATGDHNTMARILFGSPEFIEVTKFVDDAVGNARQIIKKGSDEGESLLVHFLHALTLKKT
jgi:hypothetical protein